MSKIFTIRSQRVKSSPKISDLTKTNFFQFNLTQKVGKMVFLQTSADFRSH